MRKPFNLQEALAGEPVVNGRGEVVTSFAHFPTTTKNNPYSVLALLKSADGDEVETYTESGVSMLYNTPSNADLFMVEPVEERTGWINIWQNADKFSPVYSNVHFSLAQALAERITSCSSKGKVLLGRLPFDYTYNMFTGEIKILL